LVPGPNLHDVARATLFEPLGLGLTEWHTGRDGEPIAASGLRMTVRDLAQIGMMMLRGGTADGRQVVPSQWIERCTSPIVSVDEMITGTPPTSRSESRWDGHRETSNARGSDMAKAASGCS